MIFNTVLFALGNVGSKFLVFILMPLYTNELSTAEYGVSELVLTGTNLLIPFVSVSIQDATLRFALDKKNDSGEVLKNTILILSVGSGITCLLYPFIGLYRAIAEWKLCFVLITIVYMIRNGKFFSRIFNVFNCMLVIASSVIVLIIKPFMAIYVGNAFVDCWVYVPFLLLGSIFQSYATFFGAIYTSAKKNFSVMMTTITAAIINIVLNMLLIPRIGIQGAVLATAVAYFVVFVFRMIDSQKYVRFTIDYKSVVTSVILLSLECWLAINLHDNFSYITSMIILLMIIIIYSKTLLVCAKTFLNKVKR